MTSDLRTTTPPATRRIGAVLLWILALAPSLYYLVELPNFGRIPYNDYHQVLYDLTMEDGFQTDLLTWLTIRSNEHHVTLPSLVYLGNYLLTGGDNRGHSVVTLLLILGSLLLLHSWLPRDLRRRWLPHLAVTLLLSIVLFNPVQSHNIVLGFSGVMWMLSNFLAISAMTLVWKSSRDSPRRLTLAILLGVGGALTYSSNLTLWPALLVGALRRRLPVRQWGALLATTAAVYWFYAATFVRASSSPPLEKDVTAIVRFFYAYLGSLLSIDKSTAITLGAAGLLASVITGILVLRRSPPTTSIEFDATPWLMLWIYAFGNALGTAIGRSGFADIGIGMAFSSRYANLSCLFWLSWMVPAVVLLLRWRQERPYVRAATALAITVLLVSLGLALFERGDPKYRDLLLRANAQPLAALAARHHLPEEDFYTSVTKWPWGFQRVMNRLETLHHIPFDRPPETRYAALIDVERLEILPKKRLEGRLVRTETHPDVYLIEGWLHATDLPPVRRVLFLDPEHRVRGFAFPRSDIEIDDDDRDIPKERRRQVSQVRWLGMARPRGVEPLSAWVQFEGQEALVRLRRVRFDVPAAEVQQDPEDPSSPEPSPPPEPLEAQ
ncbi:MAG: ABC transporter permease [Thermoanaerobaculia bacterium]|nr:ABC transporter permease [Thermoanaerobaculia bacterium]